MKHLVATFEIENDLSEHKLRTHLEGMGAKSLRTLPNIEHLKENLTYKQLIKAKYDAQLNLDRFINNNRE